MASKGKTPSERCFSSVFLKLIESSKHWDGSLLVRAFDLPALFGKETDGDFEKEKEKKKRKKRSEAKKKPCCIACCLILTHRGSCRVHQGCAEKLSSQVL